MWRGIFLDQFSLLLDTLLTVSSTNALSADLIAMQKLNGETGARDRQRNESVRRRQARNVANVRLFCAQNSTRNIFTQAYLLHEQSSTSFMNDSKSRIDYVLALDMPELRKLREKEEEKYTAVMRRRETFEQNLRAHGLVLEEEAEKVS